MKKRDCEHCANHTPDGCSSWECEFRARGDDLISRQDAIDAIYKAGLLTFGRKDVRTIIEELPSADRPKSEWIEDGSVEKCKDCGEQKRFPHWNFCPNCGARMVGDENE